METWDGVVDRQKQDLVNQVLRLAEEGDLVGLSDLAADSTEAARVLQDAMTELGRWAAEDAASQNGAGPVEPGPNLVADAATVIVTALSAELAVSASRAALSAFGTGRTPAQTADAVQEYLADLSLAGAQRQFGGALHGTVNAARISTFEAGPIGALYAHEVNDRNTCVPCSHVNGRFLGTTDQIDTVLLSYPDGAYGGYVLCQGGPACRGTIFGVWRPETAEA